MEVSGMSSHRAGGLVWRETDMDAVGGGQRRQEVALETSQQANIRVNRLYYVEYIIAF